MSTSPTTSFAPGSTLAGPGLTQTERVLDVFFAPSKTFTDILRSTSWWLPLLLMIFGSLAQGYVVQKQVGFERVNENQVHNSPKQEEAMSQLSPEQRAQRMAVTAKITAGITYGIPVVLLISFAVYSLILWAGFNFGLGAQTTFAQVFAVSFYAALPYLLMNVLTIAALYFGGNAEAYDYKNPAGTNPAYYLGEGAPWLKAILAEMDIIKLWTLYLQVLGMAIIAKKTMMQSAVVVGGIWVLRVLLSVGAAAAFS